ncbi:hypothetical protein SDC9_165697 [bioreactor metagenome]|uniref:Uncharacterized protein n=1 Tax=bioreactor metagenome TaxID=1076179 RepID=A0A645FUZ0_9ZZZZ
MIDLSKYDAYLIVDEAGIAITNDAPEQIKTELKGINAAYFRMYGEALVNVERYLME